MMFRNLFYYILFTAALIVNGCKFDEIKSVSTTGELSIVVDENVEPLMKAEITEFERLNPEAKVKMKSAPTTNAIVDLINGDTKLIVVSRNFTDEEKAALVRNKLELKEYPLAIDGIGFIVNVNNPVKRVTSADLQKIFSGEYKSWTDIKSQDAAENEQIQKYFKGKESDFRLYIQRKNSATNKYFQDSVLKNLQYSASAIVCSTSVQVLNGVRENENAIGIISMNWLSRGLQDTIDTTVNTLRVSKIKDNGVQEDYAEFHQGLIYNAKYPYCLCS